MKSYIRPQPFRATLVLRPFINASPLNWFGGREGIWSERFQGAEHYENSLRASLTADTPS